MGEWLALPHPGQRPGLFGYLSMDPGLGFLNHHRHFFVWHGLNMSVCTVTNIFMPNWTSVTSSPYMQVMVPGPSHLVVSLGKSPFFLILLAAQQSLPVVRGLLWTQVS